MTADVNKFWTTSGRADDFEYEMISTNDFSRRIGHLTGVTSGKLTFGYDTDLKVSGSLEVSSTKLIDDCVIKIHYKPRLSDGQTRDIVLGTFFAYADKMKFDKGRYSGTVELVSALARYTDDVLQGNFTIGKNKTYKNELKRLLKKEAAGGRYKFGSDVSDKKNKSAKTFERNKSVMEPIQAIADGLGARVDVDNSGVMIFEKYFAPSKKTCTLRLPSGQYSVTMPGVEIETGKAEMPNRVVYYCDVSWKQREYVKDKKGNKVKYKSGKNKGKYKTKKANKKKSIAGKAQVVSSSPVHYSKKGRWVTQIFSYNKKLNSKSINTTAKLNAKFAEIKKEAQSKAARKLSSLTSGRKKYVIECFYLPVTCGQVVEFEYIASGIKLHVQAMITTIELDLNVGAKMKLTLRHVRNI